MKHKKILLLLLFLTLGIPILSKFATAYGWTYSGVHFNIGTEVSDPREITWDGTHFWVLDYGGAVYGSIGEVYQYTSAGVYTGVHFAVQDYPVGITWDGTYFWIVADVSYEVYQYTSAGVYTGVHWDIGTEDTSPKGITWDGTYFWVISASTDEIYKYYSNGIYTGDHFDVALETYSPTGITWDGTYLWILERNRICKHYSNGTFTGAYFWVGDQDIHQRGITWDGTYFWVVGEQLLEVYQYQYTSDSDEPPIDWDIVIIILIIILCILEFSGFIYANHRYSWFKNFQRKRRAKVREKELKAHKFQNLLIKSKELDEKANIFYSKGKFTDAIGIWKEVIDKYNLASKKASTNDEKESIKKNLKVIKNNICKSYIENGKYHVLIAKELYNEKDLTKAEAEWNSAKNNLSNSINLIKSENLAIDNKRIKNLLKDIEFNLEQIKIEKQVEKGDRIFKNAESLQESDLSEAIKTAIDSLSLYFKTKKRAEEFPGFEGLVKKIQIKIKKASNFQSELQDKIMKLIEITPITEEPIAEDLIEVKNYECPFCGELITTELIQEYKDKDSVKCKYCEVNIPKDELNKE